MSQVLLDLRRQAGDNGLLFHIGYAELSDFLKLAVLKAGANVPEPTLYKLRHGGVSHDCGAKVRCRSTIKAISWHRGRRFSYAGAECVSRRAEKLAIDWKRRDVMISSCAVGADF